MTTEFMEMRDGKRVAVSCWEDVSKERARAAVVMVHGMCEYISRYDDFCKFLNRNGFYVIGMDNRGFGATDKDGLGLGYAGMFEDTVDDIKQEVDAAKAKWGVDKIFVIGHSYGSFLTQRFIEKYHSEIDGAILCGSALQGGAALSFGSLLANMLYKKDPKKAGKIFEKFTFVGYDKRINDGRNGWLNRDRDAVKAYNADPLCDFTCSVGFYKSFFDGIKLTNKERKKVPSDFKLMIASGDNDGVGGYGKLVKKLDKAYRGKCGITPTFRLYEDGRHEILNELNKGAVYEDFVEFLDDCLAEKRTCSI